MIRIDADGSRNMDKKKIQVAGKKNENHRKNIIHHKTLETQEK